METHVLEPGDIVKTFYEAYTVITYDCWLRLRGPKDISRYVALMQTVDADIACLWEGPKEDFEDVFVFKAGTDQWIPYQELL